MDIEFPSHGNFSPDEYLRFVSKQNLTDGSDVPHSNLESAKNSIEKIEEVSLKYPPSNFIQQSSNDFEKPLNAKSAIFITKVTDFSELAEIPTEVSANEAVVKPQSEDDEGSKIEGSEDFEDDEDLFGGISDEKENVYLEKESVYLEEEYLEYEEGVANIEENSSHHQDELTNQLVAEEKRTGQESEVNISESESNLSEGKANLGEGEVNLIEGGKQSYVGNEMAATVETNLTVTQIEAIEEDEKISTLENSMVQNETYLEQTQISKEKINSSIVNEIKNKENKQDIVETRSKELDELYSENSIAPELVDQAIDNKLKDKIFDKLCDEQGVLLRDNKDAITELKRKTHAYIQAHPEKKPSQAIEAVLKDWMNGLDLCKLDPNGNPVRLTSEEKQELIDLLASGIINYIINQNELIKSNSSKNIVEHALHDHSPITGESHKWKTSQVNDKESKEFLTIAVMFTQCMLDRSNGLALRDIKLLEQLEDIDIAYRINEMQIFKNKIKVIIEKMQIEYSDKEHRIVVLDGQTRDDIEAIFRLKAHSRKKWSKKDKSSRS